MDADLVEIVTKLIEAQSHAEVADALARFVPNGRRDSRELGLVVAALRAARIRIRGADERRLAATVRELTASQEVLRSLMKRVDGKGRP